MLAGGALHGFKHESETQILFDQTDSREQDERRVVQLRRLAQGPQREVTGCFLFPCLQRLEPPRNRFSRVDTGEAAVSQLVVVADEKREFLERRFTRAVHLDHVKEEAKDGSIEVQLEVLGRSRLHTVG